MIGILESISGFLSKFSESKHVFAKLRWSINFKMCLSSVSLASMELPGNSLPFSVLRL